MSASAPQLRQSEQQLATSNLTVTWWTDSVPWYDVFHASNTYTLGAVFRRPMNSHTNHQSGQIKLSALCLYGAFQPQIPRSNYLMDVRGSISHTR